MGFTSLFLRVAGFACGTWQSTGRDLIRKLCHCSLKINASSLSSGVPGGILYNKIFTIKISHYTVQSTCMHFKINAILF